MMITYIYKLVNLQIIVKIQEVLSFPGVGLVSHGLCIL